MSVEELLEVDHEECKSMLGSVENRLVVLRCLDSLLDDVWEKINICISSKVSVAGGGGVRRRCLPTKEIKVAGQGEVTATAKQGTGQMRTNKLGPLQSMFGGGKTAAQKQVRTSSPQFKTFASINLTDA